MCGKMTPPACSSVVEQRSYKSRVAGSIPARPTNPNSPPFGAVGILWLGSNKKGVGKTKVFPWRKPACRQAGIETEGFQGA